VKLVFGFLLVIQTSDFIGAKENIFLHYYLQNVPLGFDIVKNKNVSSIFDIVKSKRIYMHRSGHGLNF